MADSVDDKLAKAEARITGEISQPLFPFNFTFRILIISLLNLSDLSAQLESLQLAAEYVAAFVNARGAILIVR